MVSLHCSVDEAKEAAQAKMAMQVKTNGKNVLPMDYITALASLSKSNPVGALAKFVNGAKALH